MRNTAQIRDGFTLLELQVAMLLLTMGFVTLASLLATQTRAQKRIEGGFAPGATVYVTQSKDPWVKALAVPARITTTELNEANPPTVGAVNDVVIVSQQQALEAETMEVTVDVTVKP